MKKRLFSSLLCLCMVLPLLPAPARAASAAVTDAAGLAAAIAAGGEITLGGDFTVDETLTVSKSVTLDLSGHTLTAARGCSKLFCLEAGGSFIIQDSGTGGAVRATEPDPEEMHPISTDLVYMKGGEFWLKGGTLAAGKGDAVYMYYDAAGASFLMTGGALDALGDRGVAIYLRGEDNLAVVTGGTVAGDNYALYIDDASYAYVGGDVTTDGRFSNKLGTLTVTGGTHSGVLYSGSTYQYANKTATTKIYGGTFHGVWQDDYGELTLCGGTFDSEPEGAYSFQTDQTDKTLADYVGAGAALNPDAAAGTDSFRITKPVGCEPRIVGIFGAGHGRADADGITLDNANRLITDSAEVTATAGMGYTGHVDDSKDGVSLVTFLPIPPVAVLTWTEGGESKSAQLTEQEVRYGETADYLRDADPAAGAAMTFLADTAANLRFEGISPVTLTGDENGPYTLSRDMADDGYSKTGLVLNVGRSSAATVTGLTLDGSVPDEPPISTDSPKFVTVEGSLTLGEGATVQNCRPNPKNQWADLPPAAVDVDNGGSLTMASGSKIVNNQAETGGVVKGDTGAVSLSGDVTIKDNVAVDGETNAQTPANLVICQADPNPRSNDVSVRVTGALTGGEASVGLTLLDYDTYEPTAGKAAAGSGYTLTDTDLAAFFSDKPGYFPSLNTQENAIYLERYAITTQPTAENPAVAVNCAPAGIAYQWYPAAIVTEAVTDRNTTEGRFACAYADGKWTAGEDAYGSSGYFTMALKKGDVLTVTVEDGNIPEYDSLYLYDRASWEQDYTDFREGQTVYTLTAPADGTYGLELDLDMGRTAPVISATVTSVRLGQAVSGQTGATLSAPEAGDYLCRITWPDSTVLNSGIVAYEPPAHTHSWATAWSKNDTHHWHECAAQGCDITDYAACGETGAAYAAHVYDNAQDKTCNTCGYVRADPTTPDQGDVTGEVDVKPGAPAVTVDAEVLKELAGETPQGETVTVKLTVEKKEDPADKANIEAVVTGDKENVLYLDLSLLKRVNDQEPETISDTGDKVLEITVPYDFTGKKNVTVYRRHGENDAEALTGLTARPTAGSFADGSFYVDSANGVVYIYASKFSTYAIGYTAETGTPSYSSGGSSVTYYTLSATAGRGGLISPSGKISVRRNEGKTFTITPNEGYVVADVLVDGKSVGAVTEYAFEKVTRNHTIEVSFKRADTRPTWNPFEDVRFGDWFYDSVKYVYGQGMMEGTSGTAFSPGMDTSRAMIATILWRLEGNPEPKAELTYPDCVAGSWYAKAVTWGTEHGVVKGYGSGGFGPDDPITREQLAVMLWRYAGEPAVSGTLDSFADRDKAGSWAVDALCWAVERGILTGRGGGVLDPAGQATRAEAAAMLQRFSEGEK